MIYPFAPDDSSFVCEISPGGRVALAYLCYVLPYCTSHTLAWWIGMFKPIVMAWLLYSIMLMMSRRRQRLRWHPGFVSGLGITA